MSGCSLLLVDDDAELCALMAEFFAQTTYTLHHVYNGQDGLKCALTGKFDLVILDVALPVISGFTLLGKLRKHSTVPVIMLTTRDQPSDRVEGLNLGSDDYLPKPFDPDELLARIRAVLRRSGQRAEGLTVRRTGTLEMDERSRQVWSGGTRLRLTTLEYDILELLVRADGRIVQRDEIMASLFERLPSAYDRSLDVHISHLRTKLSQSKTSIQTVRGIGYMLLADGSAL